MRAFIIVIDGFGIGELPDAKKFNDSGANTLKNIINNYDMRLPVMESLGLFSIDGVYGNSNTERSAYGRVAESSTAKDTTVGHWEIAGVVTHNAFPTFPNGFPDSLIKQLENVFGKKVLCNKPYSGTEVIKDYGKEHIATGCPIIYTSADSVLQIACHTDIVSIEQLYSWCEQARSLCIGAYNVGRVIARPFSGEYPYVRTSQRKDYSVSPPTKTLLDDFADNGYCSIGVGKIEDIFNSHGLTQSYHTHNNKESMDKTIQLVKTDFDGLVFVNLIDTDMLYGHRRDVFGYAQSLEELDTQLGILRSCLRHDDIVYLTSDHGNDPCHKEHTDHTREYTPLMIFGNRILPTNLGTLQGLDTIANTVRDQFNMPHGDNSVWDRISV
ncbi:MAG: phosphopentomutase [Clostridia bacterium]|nr:phosphopentomutase [Clostridia bacterium]